MAMFVANRNARRIKISRLLGELLKNIVIASERVERLSNTSSSLEGSVVGGCLLGFGSSSAPVPFGS